jgi:hypothetical protein
MRIMYVFVYKGIKCHEAEFLDVKFSAWLFIVTSTYGFDPPTHPQQKRFENDL